MVFEGQGRGRNGDRGATATADAPERTFVRPTIGLALGGGGARGFAHIGVIRTLLERGFEPDIIVGTSIGAVVGGSYAAGHLDTFEAWARQLGRNDCASILQQTLDEEKKTDAKLTSLAEGKVNLRAAS